MDKFFLDLENGESATLPAPTICIVLLTYLRTEMALRTIQGVERHLGYPKERRVWYIADDGSPSEHMQAIRDCLTGLGETLYGEHCGPFARRPFCGKGWNMAMQKGHQAADILLWLEDDWELNQDWDIRPYVRLLLERQDVGMVTMRGLSVGNDVRTTGYRGIHYLRYLRTAEEGCTVYSGNPSLRHVRFDSYYGFFRDDLTPGNIELNYDERYRNYGNTYPAGPDIWRPADIPGWGIWGHIGQERTW